MTDQDRTQPDDAPDHTRSIRYQHGQHPVTWDKIQERPWDNPGPPPAGPWMTTTPVAAPPAGKRRRRWVPWVVGIVAVVAIVCGGGAALLAALGAGGQAVVNEIDRQIEATSQAKMADVKITKCGAPDQFGMVKIDFTVVNSSPEVQSYWVQFEVADKAGTRLAEAHGVLNDVKAGGTAKESTVTMVDGKPGEVSCSIVDAS